MLSWLQLFLVLVAIGGAWQLCDRRPQGATFEASAVNENFQVVIEGNPKTYIPGQRYNISVACDVTLKFMSFTLVVENENFSSASDSEMIGYFELTDIADTRFSSTCENMIESTNANPKTIVSVGWTAPKDGCVLIRAAVLEHRNVWFIDDGFLTKRICPEEIDEVNGQTPLMEPCCACDEAKYELFVERVWSRNTHPRGFPVEEWRTRLSGLIGASHTTDYTFWQYNSHASHGLQEFAEHGITKSLETEIKSGDIRTIIRAPGIMHRANVIGSTLANVRVDPQHHVISLISKIDPSPDWIVGVASLELCLANCTWISEKVLNLYPWDIGTDAGPSYMSPDQPQKPPDVVRRLESTFPNDERSPFFDKDGGPMKPIAMLYVRRKKLYERECESAETKQLECSTFPWNAWSECSTRCGPGTQFRTRAYREPSVAESYKCQEVLQQTRKCMGTQCGAPKVELNNGEAGSCELTTWSAWTPCSRQCGRGNSIRTREYVKPDEREQCLNDKPKQLQERRSCEGKYCGGRQTQYGGEEAMLPENDNADIHTYRNNEENENPYEENYANRLPQPEQLDFTTKRPNSNNYGRQPDFSYDRNFDEPTFDEQENTQTEPFDDIYKQQSEELGNRGTMAREGNRYDAGGGRYGANNRPNDDFDNDNLGVGMRKDYNVNGNNAILVQGSDSSNYNVVQEYCFEVPSAMRLRCARNNLPLKNFWCYDAVDRQCKIFTSDRCDDNKNKFMTIEACEDTCHMPHERQLQTQSIDEDDGQWDGQYGQFGQSESLVKKPRWNVARENRRNRQKQYERTVGDIGYNGYNG